MRSRFLLSPDEPTGGTPSGTPPPAAAVVAQGTHGEADAAELVRLKAEKADLEKRLRDRETRISEVEDENHRLRHPAAAQKRGFLDGLAEFFPRVD